MQIKTKFVNIFIKLYAIERNYAGLVLTLIMKHEKQQLAERAEVLQLNNTNKAFTQNRYRLFALNVKS